MIIGTQAYAQENEDGSTSMIYDRTEFSGWKVEAIGMSDEEEFQGVFRSTIKDGKQCEQFTLLPAKYSDDVIAQVRIYKSGDILTYGLVPINTVIFKRKKIIEIQLLCDIHVSESGNISIKLRDEFY